MAGERQVMEGIVVVGAPLSRAAMPIFTRLFGGLRRRAERSMPQDSCFARPLNMFHLLGCRVTRMSCNNRIPKGSQIADENVPSVHPHGRHDRCLRHPFPTAEGHGAQGSAPFQPSSLLSHFTTSRDHTPRHSRRRRRRSRYRPFRSPRQAHYRRRHRLRDPELPY